MRRPAPRPPAARRLPAAMLMGAVFLLLVPAAGAHAVYLASEPGKGAVLAAAPAYVAVTLTEPTDPAGTSLAVLDATDRRVDLGDLTSTGGNTPTLRVSLRPDLGDGAYRIVWRALSTADGHTTSGQVGFAVGDFAAPDSDAGGDATINWLGASGRLLAFAGLALAFGAALFLGWVPGAAHAPPLPQRPVLHALAAGATLHLLGALTLAASVLQDTGLGIAAALGTEVGRGLLVRVAAGLGAVLFAAISLAPGMPARSPPYAAVGLLAAAAVAASRFGHASLAGVPGIVTDALHQLPALAWVGGLAVLLGFLVGPARTWTPSQVQAVGVRFGTAALLCVIALLVAGFATTVAILGPPGPAFAATLREATWGRVLAAKLLLTLLMVALAAVNRYVVLAGPDEPGLAGLARRAFGRKAHGWRLPLETGTPALARFVRVEAAFGAIVLALAAVLTSISPPSSAEAPVPSYETYGEGDWFHATLRATPVPTVGTPSELAFVIETHGGERVAGNSCGREAPSSCATVVVGGEDGERNLLHPDADGVWRADGILWTQAGLVDVLVVLSTSEVPEDTMRFRVQVAA